MTRFLSLAVMCSLAFPAIALAQPEAPKEAADEMGAEYEEMTPPESGVSMEQEMSEPPKMAADDMKKESGAEESEEGKRPFLDGLSWQIMASAFYRLSGYIDDGVTVNPSGEYNTLGYPYTSYNGFGVNFAGGLVQYTGEKFGVTVDLRWGTAAPKLTPLAPLKQAYVSWMPHEKIKLDAGFFDTIFGAEVADEWNNANYTRGALYFKRQPFNHMGIRSAFSLSDIAGLTLMVTNGGVLGGKPIDDNETPTLGWQISLANDTVGFFFGGQHGASNANDNKNWDQFFDFVLTVNVDWFTLLLNGDYQISPTGILGLDGKVFAYGHSLALIFDMADKWSLGLRGEHLSGNDNYREVGSETGLATGTITLRYKPVEYLVLSLEGRGEWNTREIYFSRSGYDPTTGESTANKKQNYAAIVGFTAHIGN
ncbi:MAG: outer membrane beta-barrel protein [Polyangiales bacterium]